MNIFSKVASVFQRKNKNKINPKLHNTFNCIINLCIYRIFNKSTWNLFITIKITTYQNRQTILCEIKLLLKQRKDEYSFKHHIWHLNGGGRHVMIIHIINDIKRLPMIITIYKINNGFGCPRNLIKYYVQLLYSYCFIK